MPAVAAPAAALEEEPDLLADLEDEPDLESDLESDLAPAAAEEALEAAAEVMEPEAASEPEAALDEESAAKAPTAAARTTRIVEDFILDKMKIVGGARGILYPDKIRRHHPEHEIVVQATLTTPKSSKRLFHFQPCCGLISIETSLSPPIAHVGWVKPKPKPSEPV